MSEKPVSFWNHSKIRAGSKVTRIFVSRVELTFFPHFDRFLLSKLPTEMRARVCFLPYRAVRLGWLHCLPAQVQMAFDENNFSSKKLIKNKIKWKIFLQSSNNEKWVTFSFRTNSRSDSNCLHLAGLSSVLLLNGAACLAEQNSSQAQQFLSKLY